MKASPDRTGLADTGRDGNGRSFREDIDELLNVVARHKNETKKVRHCSGQYWLLGSGAMSLSKSPNLRQGFVDGRVCHRSGNDGLVIVVQHRGVRIILSDFPRLTNVEVTLGDSQLHEWRRCARTQLRWRQ